MTIVKTIESSPEGDWTGPEFCGPDRHHDDHASDESARIVEEAWLVKSTMEWVRDDHGPLKSLRWRAWDLCGIGHPPSRVVRKGDA